MAQRRRGRMPVPAVAPEPRLPWSSAAGIWLAVAGSAFLVWPWGEEAHTPLRFLALAGLVALTLLSPRDARLPRSVVVLLALGLVAALVAALLGAAPVAQLTGRYPRYEGLPLLVGYAAALFAGARLVSGSPAAHRLLEHALTVSVVGLAGVAAAELVVGVDRVMTTLGNASAVGVWGAMSLGVLLHRWARTTDPWAAVGTGSALVLIALSASRGALLGAATAVVVIVVLLRREGRTVLLRLGAAAAALALLALVLPATRGRLAGASPYAAATVDGRRLLWRETVSLVLDHPVLGVGPSGFVDALGRQHDATWQRSVGPVNPPDSPHDLPLQVLASTGIVGGLLVLALVSVIAVLLVRRVRAGDTWAAGILAAAAAAGTAYAFHFTDVSTAVPVLVLLGSAIGVDPDGRRETGDSVVRTTAVVGAVALVVLGASALVAETALAGRAASLLEGGSRGDTPGRGLRPWDADLDRRWGHVVVTAAVAGRADPREALAPLERAHARLPDSVEVLLDLGEARDLAGDYAGALDTFDDARRLDPTNTELALRRGVVLAELGRLQDAEQQFREVATLRPADPAAWQNLERIGALTGDDALVAEARRVLAGLGVGSP